MSTLSLPSSCLFDHGAVPPEPFISQWWGWLPHAATSLTWQTTADSERHLGGRLILKRPVLNSQRTRGLQGLGALLTPAVFGLCRRLQQWLLLFAAESWILKTRISLLGTGTLNLEAALQTESARNTQPPYPVRRQPLLQDRCPGAGSFGKVSFRACLALSETSPVERWLCWPTKHDLSLVPKL